MVGDRLCDVAGRGACVDAQHGLGADLLARLGRGEEAVEAYRTAVALTDNAAERAFLTSRATALATP
ncbi:hypothetical protein [Micromonospora trifolii]|uniref:hypothetical protein n=1 Tax=Micromonospora trifolii TaxID=2911208 RepID=UPI003CF406AB